MDSLEQVKDEFSSIKYDPLEHNCNHFTNFVYLTLLQIEIPDFVKNLTKEFLESQMGTSINYLNKKGK